MSENIEGQPSANVPEVPPVEPTTEAMVGYMLLDIADIRKTLSMMVEALTQTNHILRLMAATKEKTLTTN
jgi:hypothetical protein